MRILQEMNHMNKYIIILLILVSGTAFSQDISWQTIKGKKYDYKVDVPAGNYKRYDYSSDKEEWEGDGEPVLRLKANKSNEYPEGPQWSARGILKPYAEHDAEDRGGELLAFTETKTPIKDGLKYTARYTIKKGEQTIEVLQIAGVLLKGKYKFEERKWVNMQLIFYKPRTDMDLIATRFFDSFSYKH